MYLGRLKLVNLFTTIVTVFLMGCSATHTAVNKRELDVQTKMSSTIFLEPVTANKKTILVQVRNTSDKSDFNIEHQLKVALLDKGYNVVTNPKHAYYLLQANILQVGNTDLRAAEHALSHGYGAALGGGLAGAAVGSLASNNRDGVILGGLLGVAASTIGDAMVKDVTFSVITDIQISERADKRTAWKRYQTRVVSTANKVNLKFEQAAPKLVANLTQSLAGIF